MPRKSKKEKLLGGGMKADLLKQFIDLSYKGNTSIAPSDWDIDAPLSDSRVKVYAKKGSNDKEVVIVHRGSVGKQDWFDNIDYFLRGKVKSTKTFKLHRERQLKAVEKYGGENIIGLGHSRAGLYLQEMQKDPATKLGEIITYNKAVGFYDALRENPEEQTDVKVKNDFVSLLSGLQKRPKPMVEIEATQNPLDFNKAHQPAELEKLGDTFIGKKEEIEGGKLTNPFYTPLPIVAADYVGRKTGLFGSGTAPTPKTLEQLKKTLKTLEGKLEKINKGKVYKTTNKEKVEYGLSYTKARIKNHETKGEDLIITKKKKYGNELPAKAKPYKAKEVKPKQKEPKAKEEPKKEEPKAVKPQEVKHEPKKEVPKKEEPKKEEPKAPEPKKEEINPKLAKIEEFINDTENYLNKKSTRAFNAFMKKYDDKNFIKSIIGAQKFSDFYPTSQKCLSNYKPYIKNISEDDIILEPTAGLGSIVLWLLKNNVKSKIIATDYDPNINKYLKESFAGINQVSVLDHAKSDYLDMSNDYYKYNPSVIFLNPPFSNKGDKKYYLNFLFKALYDLKESEHPWREHQLFFISPQLTNKNEKNDQTIDFDDIVISANKKKEIKNMLNINNEDEWEDLMPHQIVKVNSCKDFGGTNFEATLYHIIIFGNPSKKEEPKKEEPKKEEPKPKPPKIKRQKAFLLEYKEVKEEVKPVKPVKPLTKKARLENFTKIFMTADEETINKIFKIMINKHVDGLEDAKYRKKILNSLIKVDAGYPSTFKFTIEDFLALYYKEKQEPKIAVNQKNLKEIFDETGATASKCKEVMCKYNINSKAEFRKWVLINHPDKGGTIDDLEFKAVIACAGKKKYCNIKEVPLEGGYFWDSKEVKEEKKAKRKAAAEAREAEYQAKKEKEKKELGDSLTKIALAFKGKRKPKAVDTAQKALDTAPKAVDTEPIAEEGQQGIEEGEPMAGAGFYLDNIAYPINPVYNYRNYGEIPSIIESEEEFLMGGSFMDMAGMNCDKTTGECFNPVWEKQKIKRQILSEYKIWYWPWGAPPAGHIRMAWLEPMIQERYQPLYDEFVARRNVNIGLPADASKDRFAKQMFSNLTDGLSYVPIFNTATSLGLSAASSLTDTKKEDGT